MTFQIIIIFLLVLSIWYTMQEGEIFEALGKWLKKVLPEKLHPPVFECNVCMTFWHGSILYWAIPWEHSFVWWMPVVISAMGLQVVLNKLSPKK